MRSTCKSSVPFNLFLFVLISASPLCGADGVFEGVVQQNVYPPQPSVVETGKSMTADAGTLGTAWYFPLTCELVDFSGTMTKLVDVGTFQVNTPGTTAIITAHGRFGIGSLDSGTGAVFEIRVDDVGPLSGKARPTVRANEVGLNPAVPDSATGFFPGLSVGPHDVSIWVRGGSFGSGEDAMIDPGCWSADHLLVELYAQPTSQAFAVSSASLPVFTTSAAKIADIATFSVSGDASVVELTYNGRFSAGGFSGGSTGAIFELRIDDQPAPSLWAAAEILAVDALNHGRSVEISGYRHGLAPGDHTASIWVRGAWGGGTDAQINPAGWHDQFLVTEHASTSATLLQVPWGGGHNFTETPSKMATIGTFEVFSPDSIIEVVFNGRVGAEFINGTGVVFELRVDDTEVSVGRSRTAVRQGDASPTADVPGHMSGYWTGLSPGTHEISIWAYGAWGGGSNASFNRGGWFSEHVLVLEHGSGEIFRDGFDLIGTAPWSAVVN